MPVKEVFSRTNVRRELLISDTDKETLKKELEKILQDHLKKCQKNTPEDKNNGVFNLINDYPIKYNVILPRDSEGIRMSIGLSPANEENSIYLWMGSNHEIASPAAEIIFNEVQSQLADVLSTRQTN